MGLVRESEMGSDPHFVSGVVCQAIRPLFHWGCAQSETKRVFFTASLGKRSAQPPRIRLWPGRTRTINGLGVEAHPVSQLAPSANETDRSTPSSHDHPSASHSPCDLGPKLHLPRKKGIPYDVSPKIVSLARKGLTGLIRHQPRNPGFEILDRGCDLTTLIGISPRTCSWPSDDVCKRMTMARVPSRLRVKSSSVFAQPLFT